MIPVGTVTLVFTDIEGSTRLWEDLPDEMAVALKRHDDIVRTTFEQAEGYIFKTAGDAFCAAFSTAPQALSAALNAQIALLTEPWAKGCEIRVRMALHTGAAESRDNDYFGPPLNRVARLLSAGHGGQVLLSLATQELCRDSLPPNVSLDDLGEHRLKDLAREERVFQVGHPVLPLISSRLRTLESLPNNLPQQTTSFVGRDKELKDLRSLLENSRLITLAGSGGSGKTRLSLQLAADELEEFPDGIWFVDLSRLSETADVPLAIAAEVGIREEPGRSQITLIVQSLASKRTLIVLDNCEHVLSQCAQAAHQLIHGCPSLKLVATSREPLGISGEQIYRVPSLSLPDPNLKTDAIQVTQFEAVKLFIDRALLANIDFKVTNENAPALASICARVDGIPLAIELAAARVRSLGLEELNARLGGSFRLLTGGSRTALPRQQTLRAMIDWSFNLLNDQERTLLRRLSVFSGGWNLEACEGVCSDENLESWEILDLLGALVDKSLVSTTETQNHVRYRLLETIREYSCEKLKEANEEPKFAAHHRDFYAALVQKAAALRSEDEHRMMSMLEMDHDNIKLAIEESIANPEHIQSGLAIVGNLKAFWAHRSFFAEADDYLHRVLALPWPPTAANERMLALDCAGWLYLLLGKEKEALNVLDELKPIATEQGDLTFTARALNGTGLLHQQWGEYELALSDYQAALAINVTLPASGRAHANYINMGTSYLSLGKYEEALISVAAADTFPIMKSEKSSVAINACVRAFIHAATCDWRESEEAALAAHNVSQAEKLYVWGVSSLNHLAQIHWMQSKFETAKEYLDLMNDWIKHLSGLNDLAECRRTEAVVLASVGEKTSAATSAIEGLKSIENPKSASVALLACAYVECSANASPESATLLAASLATRQRSPEFFHLSEQNLYKSLTQKMKDSLGQQKFDHASELGRKMSNEDAASFAHRRMTEAAS